MTINQNWTSYEKNPERLNQIKSDSIWPKMSKYIQERPTCD